MCLGKWNVVNLKASRSRKALIVLGRSNWLWGPGIWKEELRMPRERVVWELKGN